MPFGLNNTPATFQNSTNDTLREHLDLFCVVYLDDILGYSNFEDEHVAHVRTILNKLQDVGVFFKEGKCEFQVSKTEFLDYVISAQGVSIDPKKTDAVLECSTPASVKDVPTFLDFANFYGRIIREFSRIVSPMNNLLKKDQKFEWTPGANQAFIALKDTFTIAPGMTNFDPTLSCILETDASDYVAAAILSPRNQEGILDPVAFYPHKINPAECKYEIYDKELLAIV